VRGILDRVGLAEHAQTAVGELPTGLRRLADVAATLAQRPRLLLLDEPTAGLAAPEVVAFASLLRTVKGELDCAVLLIEHDVGLVMSLCDRIYVLEAGKVIASGRPREVRNDPAVIASYLGTTTAAIERSGRQRPDRAGRPLPKRSRPARRPAVALDPPPVGEDPPLSTNGAGRRRTRPGASDNQVS
jgi:ABC-type multidrug transport system ATPase subunit